MKKATLTPFLSGQKARPDPVFLFDHHRR